MNKDSFKALVVGVALGAAAIFFSDERNRKKVNRTVKNWHDKAEDEIEDIKEKGLTKVNRELSKAKAEVEKRTS